MKIINKEIRDCEYTNWIKTKVLILDYSYKWETWQIQLKDIDEWIIEKYFDKYLKILRKQVKNQYNLTKWICL